jgi:HNH endonuclease/AP2 domain
MITQERLKELVSYNPDTGKFTRIIKRTNGKSNGWPDKNGYLYLMVDGKNYAYHRLIWLYVHGKFPNNEIDHINGNKADNRIANLRDVTRTQNMQNEIKVRKSSSSGFMGVRFRKDRNTWTATIRVNGKQKRLGVFATPQEAEAAYIAAKRIYHDGFTL